MYRCTAGEWQYIMGSATSESLFTWKRATDWLVDYTDPADADLNCTVSEGAPLQAE